MPIHLNKPNTEEIWRFLLFLAMETLQNHVISKKNKIISLFGEISPGKTEKLQEGGSVLTKSMDEGGVEEKTTFCVLEYGSGLAGMGYFAMPRGDRATIPAVNRRLHNIGSNKTKKGREKSRAATTTRSLLSLLSRFFAFLSLSLSLLFSKSYRFHPL